MTTQFLTSDISWDEAPGGRPVLKAYPDPLTGGPPWTIGFGSTGPDIHEGVEWTEEQCAARRDFDLQKLQRQFQSLVWWSHTDDVRQDAFINMGYQMGFEGILKFTHTLAAVARGDWETAAGYMRSSLWDHQTPKRAERLIEQVRTGIRLPQPYDQEVVQPAPPKESIMNLISSAFHFVFDHTFAAAARAAATSNPSDAAAGIAAVQVTPIPPTGSPNSTAGQASGPIKTLEDDLNNLVMNFVKTTVDQLPVVGGIAEITGLDQQAADAAKALLVLGEQHALTFLSALFSAHHKAVDSVTGNGNA